MSTAAAGDASRPKFGNDTRFQKEVKRRVESYFSTMGLSRCGSAPMYLKTAVLLLWFGIGPGSKVAIVFLGCVFPVLINSYYGMRVVNREYVELARSFRLNGWALFLKILLPASVPFILAGVRLRRITQCIQTKPGNHQAADQQAGAINSI